MNIPPGVEAADVGAEVDGFNKGNKVKLVLFVPSGVGVGARVDAGFGVSRRIGVVVGSDVVILLGNCTLPDVFVMFGLKRGRKTTRGGIKTGITKDGGSVMSIVALQSKATYETPRGP